MASPVAVVVGACAHSLAICRSLYRSGAEVVALAPAPELPGAFTNSARVIIVDDINGAGLISDLLHLAPSISDAGTPILFLTNDTMVRTVGENYESLENRYRLSWSSTRDDVISLLNKQQLAARCRETGLNYPESRRILNSDDTTPDRLDLQPPIIFKPDMPMSAYKTMVTATIADLRDAWPTIEASLPAIAQEFISGDDSDIQFAALYLVDGEVLARFEGRKIRSRPMGHTTIAISERSDAVHKLAVRFFEGLRLSGPASLELKQDSNGTYWVIEPTVGRTDFWLGLCIRDGINLPLVEYNSERGANQDTSEQSNRSLWINGERDPFALIWLLWNKPQVLFQHSRVGVYFDWSDRGPFWQWAKNRLVTIPGRLKNKLARLIRVTESA